MRVAQEEFNLGGVEVRPPGNGGERRGVGGRRFLIGCDQMAARAPAPGERFALVGIGRFPLLPMAVIAVREVGIMAYRSYWVRRGLAIPARPSAKFKTLVQGVALAAAMCPPLEPHPWVANTLLWVAGLLVVFVPLAVAQFRRAASR